LIRDLLAPIDGGRALRVYRFATRLVFWEQQQHGQPPGR
jgi:hypothetical protein